MRSSVKLLFSELRATWTAPSGGIPEETEVPTTQMPGRNIGSEDEFILVSGSVNKVGNRVSYVFTVNRSEVSTLFEEINAPVWHTTS